VERRERERERKVRKSDKQKWGQKEISKERWGAGAVLSWGLPFCPPGSRWI
jgi:hypothetical protein